VAGVRRHPGAVPRALLTTGSTAAVIDPNGPSLAQSFPLLPAGLKPPVPATNEAQFGFGVDTETSPPSLIAAQVHAGHLAASGDPRGWEGAGEITPIQRYAGMLSGTRLTGVDGSAWYHPLRLSIDASAVAASPDNDFLDNLIPFLATVDHHEPALHRPRESRRVL
jgi:hypothetical protein